MCGEGADPLHLWWWSWLHQYFSNPGVRKEYGVSHSDPWAGTWWPGALADSARQFRLFFVHLNAHPDMSAVMCNENTLMCWRGANREEWDLEEKGRKNWQRLHALQLKPLGAELLCSCSWGKGHSAPKGKPITSLRTVNRIPGQTPLTELVSLLLSAQVHCCQTWIWWLTQCHKTCKSARAICFNTLIEPLLLQTLSKLCEWAQPWACLPSCAKASTSDPHPPLAARKLRYGNTGQHYPRTHLKCKKWHDLK